MTQCLSVGTTRQIATLDAIEIVRLTDYPQVWIGDVRDWMKQWTVANNYDPVFINDRRAFPALRLWRNKFLKEVHQNFDARLPAYAKNSLDIAQAFRFQYYLSSDLQLDDPFILQDTKHWIQLNLID